MREPKFRVWCEFEIDGIKYKEMASSASWFLMSQTGEMWDYSPQALPHLVSKEHKVIPLFYTGLKDESGQEIFEGDIVHYRETVESGAYGRTCLRRVEFVNYGFYPMARAIKSEDPMLTIELHDFVVKGNIYENPELLKNETPLT